YHIVVVILTRRDGKSLGSDTTQKQHVSLTILRLNKGGHNMAATYNRDKATKALKQAARMPSLFHSLPDQGFDIMKSEVVCWLVEQPEIRQAMFNWYKDKGAIVFRDGRWQGVETNGTQLNSF